MTFDMIFFFLFYSFALHLWYFQVLDLRSIFVPLNYQLKLRIFYFVFIRASILLFTSLAFWRKTWSDMLDGCSFLINCSNLIAAVALVSFISSDMVILKVKGADLLKIFKGSKKERKRFLKIRFVWISLSKIFDLFPGCFYLILFFTFDYYGFLQISI